MFVYGTLAGNGGQDDDPHQKSARSVSSDLKTANSEPSYGRKRLKMVITMIWSDLIWPDLTFSDWSLNFLEGSIRNDIGIFEYFLVPFWSWNPIFWLWNPIFWLWSLNFLDGKLYKEWQRDFCIFFGPFFGPEILYFGPGILYFGPGIVISLKGSFIRNDRAIFVSFLVPFLVPKSYILDPES